MPARSLAATRSRSAAWVRPGTRLVSRFSPFGAGCRALAATSRGSRSCVVTPALSRTRWAVVPRRASTMARRNVTDVAGCGAAGAVLHARHRWRSPAIDTPPPWIGDLNAITPFPPRESKTAMPLVPQALASGPSLMDAPKSHRTRAISAARRARRSVRARGRARAARFGQSVRVAESQRLVRQAALEDEPGS